jgi:hypothetical protein
MHSAKDGDDEQDGEKNNKEFGSRHLAPESA